MYKLILLLIVFTEEFLEDICLFNRKVYSVSFKDNWQFYSIYNNNYYKETLLANIKHIKESYLYIFFRVDLLKLFQRHHNLLHMDSQKLKEL